jgi:hypothetical protein
MRQDGIHAMPNRLEDGSIIDDDGEVLFFSKERFVSQICNGDNCFVCGASRESREFDDEHVIPQWILRKFNMYGAMVTLPNNTQIRYDRYTIPCCVACNRSLGKELEVPVSNLLSGGYQSYIEHSKDVGEWRLFIWLCLLFFKTHYKDRSLRLFRDRRKPPHSISEIYEWEELHHIHCIIRSAVVSQEVERGALGTVSIFRTKTSNLYSEYDYHDLYGPRALMVRMGDIGIVSVLNDAGAAGIIFSKQIPAITGPLSPIQIREVLAHHSYINDQLQERPRFATTLTRMGNVRMVAKVPYEIRLKEYSADKFGSLLENCCLSVLTSVRAPDMDIQRENMRRGEWTTLYLEDHTFRDDSMELI